MPWPHHLIHPTRGCLLPLPPAFATSVCLLAVLTSCTCSQPSVLSHSGRICDGPEVSLMGTFGVALFACAVPAQELARRNVFVIHTGQMDGLALRGAISVRHMPFREASLCASCASYRTMYIRCFVPEISGRLSLEGRDSASTKGIRDPQRLLCRCGPSARKSDTERQIMAKRVSCQDTRAGKSKSSALLETDTDTVAALLWFQSATRLARVMHETPHTRANTRLR